MKETDIRKYAQLMQEYGLTGFEITEDSKTVRLERNITTVTNEPVLSTTAMPVTLQENTAETVDYISVKSPMVGVFYAAPTENADPFVSLGVRVKKGQTLCIIEAMKLMNDICAEDDGTICEICVTNGQVVEYGTELFRLKR